MSGTRRPVQQNGGCRLIVRCGHVIGSDLIGAALQFGGLGQRCKSLVVLAA